MRTAVRDASSAGRQGRTKSTYGLQWNRFRVVRPEEDEATFRTRTGLGPEELHGRLVLDAGCGMGRYARVAAGFGARVLGLDLSEAVRAARDVTSDCPGVGIVRGDLLRPPFPDGTFDHVYSLGVVDHTPAPAEVVRRLAGLLKPGGRLVIWVYRRERPTLEAIIEAHRAVSKRLPLPMLVGLCHLMAPVGGWKRRLMVSRNPLVARAGVALNLLTIGVSMHPDAEVRVCDTLDWYAPQYASRHTFDEVAGWFRDAGLVEITDLSPSQQHYHEGQGNGINVAGRRPR